MGLTSDTLAKVRAFLADPAPRRDDETLDVLLRALAKWRSKVLANSIIQIHGRRILGGPFAGMEYLDHAAEGALLPRLIGCYESELHPHLAALAAEGLERIIDVGCAEGYYAVGLARMLPEVEVLAYDTDPKARADCAKLAAMNGVSDRVKIGETFAGDDFAQFENTRTLVFMDIEGGEHILLDPDRWPALRTLPIVVETHGGPKFAIAIELERRFAASHDIFRVDHGGKNPE